MVRFGRTRRVRRGRGGSYTIGGGRGLRRDRDEPAAQYRSSRDSPLEEAGFEPSVPRDPKFSTPAHVTCLTPCTPTGRREREPILRGCRPPPAEPMVRIRLPPSGESTNFRFLSRRCPLFDRMISLPSRGPRQKGSSRQSAASSVRRRGPPRR